MGDVKILYLDAITEKSGHSIVPMAVSVCTTPAAPSPLPIPYPVVGNSAEGVGDAPMRTKISRCGMARGGRSISRLWGRAKARSTGASGCFCRATRTGPIASSTWPRA
jgi:hypothetical protein